MANNTITISTPIFTSHADFAGYEWLSGILGNMSPREWVETAESNGDTLTTQSEQLAGYIGGMIGEGFFLTEQELDEAREERFPDSAARENREFTCVEAIQEIYKQAGCVRLAETVIVSCSGGFGEYETHPNGYDLFKDGEIFPDAETALKAWEDVVDDDTTTSLHLKSMAEHITEAENILGRIHNEPQHVYIVRRDGQESTYAGLEIRPVEPRDE